MATIEIDENQYAELKRVYDVAGLIQNDPEAVRWMQKAVKKVAPDKIGPEIRIRDEMDERIGGLEKKLDEWFSEQKKDRDERADAEAKRDLEKRWLEGRKAARDAGYHEEGLGKLEEFMEREGIVSHKHAIPAFERENPLPEPVVSANPGFNFFDFRGQQGDDAKMFERLMNGDTEGFLDESVPKALKEARGR